MSGNRAFTASKAAQVLLALSITLTLVSQLVPWVQVSLGVLSLAGATVALWPTCALACGGVIGLGSSCFFESTANAFVQLTGLIGLSLTSAFGALATACFVAVVAAAVATVLLSLALLYSGRARRALSANDCCSCACTDTSCAGCFCDGGARSGSRVCARGAAVGLAVVSSLILFAAAGNFGSQLYPVLNLLQPAAAANFLGGGLQINTAGQTLTYIAAALALAAAAADFAGLFCAPKVSDGSEIYIPQQTAGVLPPHAYGVAAVAVSPQYVVAHAVPVAQPAPQQQQVFIATRSPLQALPAVGQQQQDPQPPATKQAKFCASCGVPRSADSLFCAGCGAKH